MLSTLLKAYFSVCQSHLSCCLQMLLIWTSVIFCNLVRLKWHKGSFTPQILILTHQQQTALEIIVGKGEIDHSEQFLLFPQCFLFNQKIVSPFAHIFDFIQWKPIITRSSGSIDQTRDIPLYVPPLPRRPRMACIRGRSSHIMNIFTI